jgi:hypothetical protein
MNATALQQMPPRPQILSMLAWFAQRYRARHGREIARSTDLAQVTSAGVFLVDFLALRSHRPLPSGQIPVLVSGLYKVCLGFQLAYLEDQFDDETTPTELPDASGFYSYLEHHELLIGEAEVCSGSPAMIIQAYEAMLQGQEFPEHDLPPSCTGLEIDWERFDAFADNAASLWRELAIFAMRMPEFLPRLADPRIPPDIEQRLNARLAERGSELLAGQTGLLIQIARGLQGPPSAPPPALPVEPIAVPEPGSVAASVLEWLTATSETDFRRFTPIVAADLQAQLGAYDSYEGALVDALNQRLAALLLSLGFEPQTPLTAAVLPGIYGRTLREWSESSGKGEQ